MQEPASPPTLLQFVPLLVMTIPLVILISRIAIRKGRSAWLGALGIVPLVNVLLAIWVASLPDAELLRQPEELKSRLQEKA